VEQDDSPVAVRTPQTTGRLLSESIALAKARGSTVTPDDGYKEVEERISGRASSKSPFPQQAAEKCTGRLKACPTKACNH